jgi:hypothetical protein
MTLEETARLKLIIDGAEAVNDLQKLTDKITQLKAEQDKFTKSDPEWHKLNNEIKGLTTTVNTVRERMDVAGMTIRQLEDYQKQLNKALRDADPASDDLLKIKGKADEVSGRLKELKGRVSDIPEEMEKSKGTFDNWKGWVAGAFTVTAIVETAKAIWDFGVASVKAFQESDQAQAQLRASLNSTGEAAGLSLEKLNKMATDRAKVTLFDDDDITKSQAMLLTFTEIKGKIFEEAIPAITDMAQKMGGGPEGLQTATIQVGKALNDPIKGITALSKVGVTFSADQKEVIKRLVETGDKASAQRIILAELNKEFGGSAEAAANAESGGLLQLQKRFGNIMESIGGLFVSVSKSLMPILNNLFSLFESGVEVLINVFKNTEPITTVFTAVYEVVGNLFSSVGNLISQLFSLIAPMFHVKEGGSMLTTIMDALAVAFKIVYSAAMIVLTGFQIVLDGMSILINKGKEVANFFGSDFKIDPKSNFDNLQANADKNFQSIKTLWTDTSDHKVKKNEETNTKIYKHDTDTHENSTASAKKAAEKQASDKLKATEDVSKKIEDLRIKLDDNDEKRHISSLKLQYDREVAAINKSKASEAAKAEYLELLHKNFEKDKAAITAKEDEKTKKEKEKNEKELDKIRDKFEKDDTSRKIKALKDEASRNEKFIKETVKDEKEKTDLLRKLEQSLIADISKLHNDADQKRKKEEEKIIQDKLKNEKAMFDQEFQMTVAKNNLILNDTKSTIDQELAAKKAMLDAELQHKIANLNNQAAAARAKANSEVASEQDRASRTQAINDNLMAQITAATQASANAKAAAEEASAQKRVEANKAMFSAISDLAKGDYNSFIKILSDKATNEGKNLSESQKANVEKIDKVQEYTVLALETLKTLNAAHLEKQIQNINKERDTFLEDNKKKYDGGVINKEDYEKNIETINSEADAKLYAERKKSFEREKAMNIALAVVNAAQAALKSFAMMGWPLGLIGAAGAAVAAAIQIKQIKSQKFEGRAGGVFKNAGIAQGDAHGSSYGEAGIAMINRRTGDEVGEIEGGEPVMILSKNTYRNNKKIIDPLLHSSLHRNGAAIYQKGGIMFEDGGVVGDAGADNGATHAAIAESSTIQKEIRDNTKKTADYTAELVDDIQKLRLVTAAMSLSLRSVLGSIDHNTARTADNTGNTAGGIAQLSSKFK